MNQTKSSNFNRPWAWCAAVVGLSALVGVWNAEDPHAIRTLSKTAISNTEQPCAAPSRLEQIESTLAQAGCPGWMVLASEGEAALQKPTDPDLSTQTREKSLPSEVQLVSHKVGATAHVPRVSYPTPVHVASRRLFAPPAQSAKVSVGAADAPDDLLDGKPDLLAVPAEESSTPEPVPTDPTPPPPTPPAPAQSSSEVDVSADEQPQPAPTNEPAFPAPPTPTKKTTKIIPSTRQPQAKPELVPAIPETIEPPADQSPGPFVPPATPRIETPQGSIPQLPQVPVTTPVVQQPRQSPFAPPPAPRQPAPHSLGGAQALGGDQAKSSAKKQQGDAKTYCEFVAESQYPSAQACAKCHEKIYDEWSVSSHAYAAVSPMYQKFEQRINDLSQGTIGYFCYRCHTPVGVSMGLSRAAPIWDLPLVAREGVTCIACHRVNQRYGKVNGERRIEPGDIHASVYGPIGGSGVAEVIAQKNKYKVKTSPHEKGPGQDIHVAGECFDQLSKPEFCVSCHQVAVDPGIKLEVVWEQYRASPACKKGVSCQDCHMGRIPGVASGYETGAAAKIGEKTVSTQRKHANHVFYGPGYSIAHPGIFPHNIDANRWSMQEWLQFDWRAGWGTENFEDLVDDGKVRVNFPTIWAEADDRYDAREIIDDNLKKLDAKKISRQQIMENGSHVDGPFFDTQLVRGQDLKFHYVMTNNNEGHNLPSGSLGAQPQLWANVVLIGPRGQRLWESGYTDSWGDVADIHSEDVRNKRIPFDWQLFNLQTMFLITGAKGTDREFYLPVNFDFDQLPYLRPGAQPTSVINHPPFIRMEGRSLAPLGSRRIPYKVPAELMCEPGHYRLSFRLRSRLEPIYFMRFCGSTNEMIRAMNEGILDFHQSSIEFFVK